MQQQTITDLIKQNEKFLEAASINLATIETMRKLLDQKQETKKSDPEKITIIGDSNARRIAEQNKEKIEYIQAKTANT